MRACAHEKISGVPRLQKIVAYALQQTLLVLSRVVKIKKKRGEYILYNNFLDVHVVQPYAHPHISTDDVSTRKVVHETRRLLEEEEEPYRT